MSKKVIGIDVGSTTTKIAVNQDGKLIYHKYIRHLARQRDSIVSLIEELLESTDIKNAVVCLTGSG